MKTNPSLHLVMFLLFITFFASNCRKLSDDKLTEAEGAFAPNPKEKQFFTIPDSTPAIVTKVIAHIINSKNKSEFADRIIKEAGFPIWNKALVFVNNADANRVSQTNKDSNYLFIPIVTEGTKEVEGHWPAR